MTKLNLPDPRDISSPVGYPMTNAKVLVKLLDRHEVRRDGECDPTRVRGPNAFPVIDLQRMELDTSHGKEI